MKLIVVATFSYPEDLLIIKSRLESEGIECFLNDEFTIQTYSLYSNALGGVKLLVKEQDVAFAITILKENGYVSEQAPSHPSFIDKILLSISDISLFRNVSVELKLIFIIGFLLLLLTAVSYYLLKPNLKEELMSNEWCIDTIVFNGERLAPSSSGIQIIGKRFCDETLSFPTDNTIRLPGINTYAPLAECKVEDDSLTIKYIDTLRNVYVGSYSIKISQNTLILKSKNTLLVGYKERNINSLR